MTRRLVPFVLAIGLIGSSAGPLGARMLPAEADLLDRVGEPARVSAAEATELLVRYKPGRAAAARATVRARAGVARVRSLPAAGWELARPAAGEDIDDAMARLAADPSVQEVIPDLRVHATTTPNDTHLSSQWALHNTGQAYLGGLRGSEDADVDGPEAWDTSTGDASVVIAVVDTGVAYDHADLSPNMWINPDEIASNGIDDDGNGFVDDVRGWDWVDGDNDPYDEEARDVENGDPHGTHVAGIVGARGNNSYGVTGVGWTTTIMPLRVLGPSGGAISDILDAMSYAVEEGAHVVNLSLGATGSNASQRTALNNLFRGVVNASPDTLFVAAAGNETANNETNPMYPCATTSDNVLCVAATNDDDALAGFSSYGSTSVDMAAPGELILSTAAPGYLMYMSGTSMATPMVAGAAGVLLAVDPAATPGELKDALMNSGDAIGSLASKTVSGRRLNLAEALLYLQFPPTFADVPPSHKLYPYIQAIYDAGITTGCASEPLRFCPDRTVDRKQMAVFLLRAMGEASALSSGTGVFADAPVGWQYTPYIERFYDLEITTGCRNGPLRYCPERDLDRAQMAVFILRALGHDGHLPAFQGFFPDAPEGWKYTPFIEHFYDPHEITTGCGGGRYCSSRVVDRGQMAVFIARAFGLVAE